jgi:hypothetical protein
MLVVTGYTGGFALVSKIMVSGRELIVGHGVDELFGTGFCTFPFLNQHSRLIVWHTELITTLRYKNSYHGALPSACLNSSPYHLKSFFTSHKS